MTIGKNLVGFFGYNLDGQRMSKLKSNVTGFNENKIHGSLTSFRSFSNFFFKGKWETSKLVNYYKEKESNSTLIMALLLQSRQRGSSLPKKKLFLCVGCLQLSISIKFQFNHNNNKRLIKWTNGDVLLFQNIKQIKIKIRQQDLLKWSSFFLVWSDVPSHNIWHIIVFLSVCFICIFMLLNSHLLLTTCYVRHKFTEPYMENSSQK